MSLPKDYLERVYAGVLGKIIGVYLGRPFEGTRYRDMLKRFGMVNYYVTDEKTPIVLIDDDISGTFTFLRALEDYAHKGKDITSADIGQTWLNYLIEERNVLWWGGLGASTEHTAYLRLKAGIKAPRSGSIELNSQVVAEQIGAQIFIDGWGMVAPGDPQLAAHFAKMAGSVSHDGESVYAAQVVAAMEALAFVESDLNILLDTAVKFIPPDCLIRKMIHDLRDFHAKEPDWNKAMTDLMEVKYGYDKFGGFCHVIPNHGLIILGLLYGNDDFQQSLAITNTCGWDTDCNSGNVGCLLGIKNGLHGIDATADFRGPVADRMLVSTADGSGAVTDALTQTYRIANMARALNDQPPLKPKNGARFHFSLPGSLQGFTVDNANDVRGTTTLSNIDGKLAIHFNRLAPGRVARASTPTFATPETFNLPGYALAASPFLLPGQVISATLAAPASNKSPVTVRLFINHFAVKDVPTRIYGPQATFAPGQSHCLSFVAPDPDGMPHFAVGVEILGHNGASGIILLDRLSITGDPTLTLAKIPDSNMWRRGWVDGVNAQMTWHGPDYMLIQNRGRGLNLYGGRDWHDYTVSAELTPHLAAAAGLAARVQGMQRFYALQLLHPDKIQLIKVLDGTTVLAEAPFPWKLNNDPHRLSLTVKDNHISASVDDKPLFNFTDTELPLTCGGIALLIEEGRLNSGPVSVKPA